MIHRNICTQQDANVKVYDNRHRLSFHGGVKLLQVWVDGFMEHGPKDDHDYRCWSVFYKMMDTTVRDPTSSLQSLSNWLDSNTDNFAAQLFFGSSIIVFSEYNPMRIFGGDPNAGFPPIEYYMGYLKKAYSVWRHPLVLIIMARVLGLDHNDSRSIRQSLRIWENVLRDSLDGIVNFLPNPEEGHNRVRYHTELRWDIKKEIANCHILLSRNRKKKHHLKRALNLYDYLRRHFIGTGCLCDHCIIWEEIQIMTTRIKLLFWIGDYHSAYQSVTEMMSLCTEKRLRLNPHSARTCYVVFMKLQKYEEWGRALKQQSRTGLVSPPRDSLNATQSQWQLLVNDVYRTYLSLHGVDQRMAFEDLYEDIVSRIFDQMEPIADIGPYLVIFEEEYERRFHDNLLGGSYHWFETISMHHINEYVEHIGITNDCKDDPLCVGMAVHYSLMAEYANYRLLRYKLAHYLYAFYHEINPHDPLGYHNHGLLLQKAGKMKRAEKYLEKARRLNVKSELDLESHLLVDPEMIELDMDDQCGYCGERGEGFKRCARCKVMFYCSRLCQKKHWKKEHRETCVHREENELKPAHKLLHFVGKRKNSNPMIVIS